MSVLEQVVEAKPSYVPTKLCNFMRMRPKVRTATLKVILKLPRLQIHGALGVGPSSPYVDLAKTASQASPEHPPGDR